MGVRDEIAAGDLRPLYLAWLVGYGTWERDEYAFDRDEDDALEPPVPPGLRSLTAAQHALADFLRLDDVLLDVAAAASTEIEDAADDPCELAGRISDLAESEKDRLLLRVVTGHPATVRRELLRRFQDHDANAAPDAPRRTVAEILDTTANQRAERERQAAAQRAEEEARRAQARMLARERRLDELARDEDAAWARVDAMIETRKPAEYDAAITLLTDLRALADRDGHPDTFIQRSMALRREHARKPSLIERFNRAGIGT